MPLLNNEQKNIFHSESVLFLKNLFEKKLCENALNWLTEKEAFLIEKYKEDNRGMVFENIKGEKFIKYFEYPLYANPKVFTPFMNSKVFEYASELLNDEVIFKSLEIHSRFPGSELIPIHQDNAYYGLKNGKALTFYVPINKQTSTEGGLNYLAIKNSNEVFEHKASKSTAFSLEVKDKEGVLKNYEQRQFDFEPGDCAIHYSNSMHFAKEVPKYAHRSWVVRFSFFSAKSKIKLGHKEWYQKMIAENRSANAYK